VYGSKRRLPTTNEIDELNRVTSGFKRYSKGQERGSWEDRRGERVLDWVASTVGGVRCKVSMAREKRGVVVE
jgi:hypothetical protein